MLLHEGGIAERPVHTDPVNDVHVGSPGRSSTSSANTTDAVDLFVTGHTHQPYNCVIDGRPVTSASSFGRLVTDIDLTLGRNGDVKSVSRRQHPRCTSTGRTRAAGRRQSLIKCYDGPLDGRCGDAGRPDHASSITRDGDDSGENPAGNLIADAQLADTDDGRPRRAVGALMNPGGVRADFTFAQSAARATASSPTRRRSPSSRSTTSSPPRRSRAPQLLDVLKDQWCGTNRRPPTVLLPSSTINYTFDQSVATVDPRRRRAPGRRTR